MAKSDRIPLFNEDGNLPVGIHQVFLGDIENRFTWNEKRKKLFAGLTKAAINLASAGVLLVYIDGSFVTNKEEPNDIDGCWVVPPGIDCDVLDILFLKERNQPGDNMRNKYGIDFFIHGTDEGANGLSIEEFFKTDADGNAKGVLLLKL